MTILDTEPVEEGDKDVQDRAKYRQVGSLGPAVVRGLENCRRLLLEHLATKDHQPRRHLIAQSGHELLLAYLQRAAHCGYDLQVTDGSMNGQCIERSPRSRKCSFGSVWTVTGRLTYGREVIEIEHVQILGQGTEYEQHEFRLMVLWNGGSRGVEKLCEALLGREGKGGVGVHTHLAYGDEVRELLGREGKGGWAYTPPFCIW